MNQQDQLNEIVIRLIAIESILNQILTVEKDLVMEDPYDG